MVHLWLAPVQICLEQFFVHLTANLSMRVCSYNTLSHNGLSERCSGYSGCAENVLFNFDASSSAPRPPSTSGATHQATTPI